MQSSFRVSGAARCLWLVASIAASTAAVDATPSPAGFVNALAPDWVTSITPGTWQAISQNTLADVDPAADPRVNPNFPGAPPWRGNSGQKSVLNAWNGGAFATRFGALGSLIVFGGGHNDYFGNEIYAFDLEKLRWDRITDPYTATREVLTARYEGGSFPDGSPLPPHTYDYVEYDPASNSFVLLKGLQQLGVSGGTHEGVPAFLFDFASRTWRRSPAAVAHYGSSGWSAYDSRRGVFWINPPSITPRAGFRSFDPHHADGSGPVGTWSDSLGPRKTGGGDGMAAYIPALDLIIYTDFKKPPGAVYAVDLSRPGYAAVKLKVGGIAPMLGAAHGWEWSDLRQALIYWPRDAGAAVHELRLAGKDWRSGVWTWAPITRDSNLVVPEAMTANNGIYGRFRIVRFLDAEVAVVVTRVDGPVYAFRIPDADLQRASAPSARTID